MPTAVNDKSKEEMWNALKSHIIRERQRKKQEREQEVEEERQRKEREATEQQQVMSLGETREQITQLELKLTQLRDEKHQLFLQLKKVLNEDDNRRRQLKEDVFSEMFKMQNMPSTGLVHQQLFLPQTVPRPAPMAPQNFKPTSKRQRTPSPTNVPVSLYHQTYYKPQTIPNTSYQPPPPQQQKDDNHRGHELVRAVLWNKTPQYTNQPGTFYSGSPQELVFYQPMPLCPDTKPPPPRSVYDPPRPQTYDIEPKHVDHYNLRPPTTHVTLHGNSMPLNQAQPPPKTGSITSGYPVKSQPQYVFTIRSRPMFTAPKNWPYTGGNK